MKRKEQAMDRDMTQGRRKAKGRSERGFSITEMLTVLALAGLMITFVGPAFSESYKAYKVRAAALEISDTLRAVRQVAVSTRTASSLVIDTTAGTFSWTDIRGRARSVPLTPPVHFVSASPATITFITDGTVSTGTASVVLQNTINSAIADRWTLDLNTVGKITTTKSQVAP
jgi:prepilin-type N-terminal cleavage/methylation domain-containing protein